MSSKIASCRLRSRSDTACAISGGTVADQPVVVIAGSCAVEAALSIEWPTELLLLTSVPGTDGESRRIGPEMTGAGRAAGLEAPRREDMALMVLRKPDVRPSGGGEPVPSMPLGGGEPGEEMESRGLLMLPETELAIDKGRALDEEGLRG